MDKLPRESAFFKGGLPHILQHNKEEDVLDLVAASSSVGSSQVSQWTLIPSVSLYLLCTSVWELFQCLALLVISKPKTSRSIREYHCSLDFDLLHRGVLSYAMKLEIMSGDLSGISAHLSKDSFLKVTKS